MKTILVSCRVDCIDAYDEKRDAIDQEWFSFLSLVGVVPILVPNHKETLKYYLSNMAIDGVLLTGGNSLASYGGKAPERDEIESELLTFSIEEKIPLIGICRGMQMIQDYFGLKLRTASNHIQKQQTINFGDQIIEVNSYHTWGCSESNEFLIIDALSDDQIIKATHHRDYPIWGLMWHPERIQPFSARDILLFQKVFNI